MKITYRLFEEVQWHGSFAKKSIVELTISSFLVKSNVKKAETYTLLKTQAMLLSETGRKGQLDADLHAVQEPEHAPISKKQESQPDADLHPVQNPVQASVSNQ